MIKIINLILKGFHLRLVNGSQGINDLYYISAKNTVKEAAKNDQSICEYVEHIWGQIGETEKVITNMAQSGIFNGNISSICEIGTGTGRYMEKVIERCNPEYYESYETAADWAEWLQKTYPIISQPTDGFSLKETKDNSMDLIHAHGVFVYLKFLDNIRYFNDMIKKTKTGGFIVFDCYTEDCMTNDILDKWLTSNHTYPSILPNNYVLNYFKKRGLKFIQNFYNRHGQGRSKYFVFRKLS